MHLQEPSTKERPKSSDKGKHKKFFQHDRSSVLVDILPVQVALSFRHYCYEESEDFGEKKEEGIVERSMCMCVRIPYVKNVWALKTRMMMMVVCR